MRLFFSESAFMIKTHQSMQSESKIYAYIRVMFYGIYSERDFNINVYLTHRQNY